MENQAGILEEREINKILSQILSNEKLTRYIDDIWELVLANKATKEAINRILLEYKIKDTEEIKEELIDFILLFIDLLIRNVRYNMDLSQNEVNFVRRLMRLFAINDGDTYKFRDGIISKILQPELEKMYFDNKIDDQESIYKVKLQEIFGLSYDQFLEYVNIEDKKTLERGASIIDLDTVYFSNTEKEKTLYSQEAQKEFA